MWVPELLSSLSKFNTTQLGCSRKRGEDESQTCVLLMGHLSQEPIVGGF